MMRLKVMALLCTKTEENAMPHRFKVRAGTFALRRDCQLSRTRGNRRGFGKPIGCLVPRGFQRNSPSACGCPNPDAGADGRNPAPSAATPVQFCRVSLWDKRGRARGTTRLNPVVSIRQVLFQIAGKASDLPALPLR